MTYAKRIKNLMKNKNNYTHIKSMGGGYDIVCVEYNKNMREKLLVALKTSL